MLAKPRTRDPLRQALRDAVAVRLHAQRKLTTEQSALDRANAVLKEREGALAKYVGVDELLAQARTEAEKAFIRSGGSGNRQTVPPDIVQAIRERDEAAESVKLAQSAVQSLAADVERARAALAGAERRTNAAAAAVIVEHVKAEAALLRQAQEAVWRLSASIRGASRLWVPANSAGTLAPITLPREVLSSLDRQEPPTAPASNLEVLSAARYRAWHLTLQSNPDISIEGATYEQKSQCA
jgi:hypothetical protein